MSGVKRKYSYFFASIIPFLMAAIRLTFFPHLGLKVPYVMFYPVVVLSALYGGLRAGLVSLVISALIIDYFWLDSPRGFGMREYSDWLGMIIFIVTSIFISWVIERMHKAQARAISAESELKFLTEQKRMKKELRESEEHLKLAQVSAGAGVWDWDVQTNKIEWSEELFRLFGLDPGKTVASFASWKSATHPDDVEAAQERIDTAIQEHTPLDSEYRVLLPSGGLRWINAIGNTTYDNSGAPLRMSGICIDITERKRSEEALRNAEKMLQENRMELERAKMLQEERKRLYDLLETLPVYVVLLTPDYHVSFANRFFRERFGEDHGRCCFDYLFKRQGPCENCETYKVLKTNLPHNWEWLGPDGRNYDIYDFPFQERDGSTHIMEMGIDITERKRAQEELMQARDAIAESKRLSDIGMLAATVAHELRNPLAAIKMASYNIKRKSKDSALESHLKNIDIKVDESEQIISNLLFYSRIKMPRLDSINIHNILKACIHDAQERFAQKHAVIDSDLNSMKDMLVKADALQMKEVFSNILVNAFEAIPDEGGRITLKSVKGENVLKIAINDNGEGIDEGVLNRLFEPFFTTKAKGTGLGLPLCREIMHLHNGSIEIESKKGSWTTVTLSLPITQ
ncbi:MAG TPA: ATP-binding protein [Candidatus Margulisiibacteriota bacterium]|nr:ATP-binding protein [Candidatus Margulisiibacteriota bacterium]